MQNARKKTIFIVSIALILLITGYILRIDRFDRFGMAQISWVDCVQINNAKYYSDFNRKTVEKSLLDTKIGDVQFNISKNVHNASYKFRNGDATYLEIGTEIYSLTSDKNAIAVKIGDFYYLYRNDLYE